MEDGSDGQEQSRRSYCKDLIELGEFGVRDLLFSQSQESQSSRSDIWDELRERGGMKRGSSKRDRKIKERKGQVYRSNLNIVSQ